MSGIEDIVIRNALISDLPRIVEIYNSTVPGRMVTADTVPVTVESRVDWFHQHSPEKRPLWVAEQEDKIWGWLSFQSFYGRPAYNSTAELSIYVDEKFRRKGLGRVLINKAILNCEELKVKTLLGFVFGHNCPSINLFHSFDFEDWGILPGVAELEGIERDLIILGRRVR